MTKTVATDRYLTRSEQRELDLLAQAVADEHGSSGFVDPLAIARAQRLTISFNDYGDSFDGLLEHKSGRFHIYCNTSRCGGPQESRARFTVAHELGHYFIDDHRRPLQRGLPSHASRTEFSARNFAERQADWFAGGVLMPATRFIKAARGVRSLNGIIGLAEDFKASVTAAAVRFASLDVRPCAVLCWRGDQITWRALSPAFFEAKYRTTISKRSEVPADSPTGLVLGGGVSPGVVQQAGTTAASWFRYVEDVSDRNVILMESAVALGRYGALTALFPADSI